MVDPTTVNRSLAVPTHGSDVDTWDQPLNNNFGLLDTIVGGIANVSTTGGATTLNAAQLACGTISVSGVLTSDAILTFPAVQGWWSIENLTTGSFNVVIRPVGFSTQIAIQPGCVQDIQINGTVVKFRNLPMVGSYLDVGAVTVPLWILACNPPPYLNCDGSTFSAVTFPYLNNVLGGTTLPDLRGVTRATLNQGTSRITSAGSGIDGNTRFSTGGSQSMQGHTHSFSGTTQIESNSHFHGGVIVGGVGTTTGGGGFAAISSLTGGTSGGQDVPHTHTYSGTTANFGSGNSQNMPPTTIAGITLIRAA